MTANWPPQPTVSRSPAVPTWAKPPAPPVAGNAFHLRIVPLTIGHHVPLNEAWGEPFDSTSVGASSRGVHTEWTSSTVAWP
jgi:hypothetical protein